MFALFFQFNFLEERLGICDDPRRLESEIGIINWHIDTLFDTHWHFSEHIDTFSVHIDTFSEYNDTFLLYTLTLFVKEGKNCKLTNFKFRATRPLYFENSS